jgi:hypothetical protein
MKTLDFLVGEWTGEGQRRYGLFRVKIGLVRKMK